MARLRRFLPFLLILLCGLGGYWIVQNEAGAPPRAARQEPRRPVRTEVPEEEPPAPAKSSVRDKFADGTTIEIFGSCRPEELILRFPTDDSYTSFIRTLEESPVRLFDRLDPLRAMRVGGSTAEMEALSLLFEDEEITVYKTLTRLPTPPQATGGTNNGRALRFDDQVLSWLGVTSDYSRWGAGVKVAVLDSGVAEHPGLARSFRSIDVIPFPTDSAAMHPHGTAVASLIVGTSAIAPGLAPAAQLISVRVLDDTGTSDAFFIAKGILAAMDAGAEILNLSLGEQDDCPLLGDAIRMALDAGVVVVASSGNEGLQAAKYPAAYPGVIGVGAIDASGERMAFSNLGQGLGLTAPGYGVNAAAPGGGYVSISGTSASAPLVTAAIAAVMSDGSGRRIRATEAAKIVLGCTDDEGVPGADREYGSGVLNLDRIMNRGTRGRYDAAITCVRILPADGPGRPQQIEVSVQNRGTEILINSLVEISTAAGVTKINATTIAPGAIQSFTAPLNSAALQGDIAASATLDHGIADMTPDNNFRAGRISGGS